MAVPVWAKVSETPETTAMKTVTEVERADGLLRLEPDGLGLEVEIVQATMTLGGTGTTTDKESLGTRELRIPFDRLVDVSMRGGWWWPRIRIQTDSLRAVEGLPGAKRGVVELRVSLRNRRAARSLVNEVEFVRADLAFERATVQDLQRLGERVDEVREEYAG
jgi:hypothetical protein